MIRRNALLGLAAILILAVIAVSAYATEGPDVPVPVASTPASNGTQQATLYAVLGLAVMQVSQWLKQILDAQKERRACAEAEAEEAQAKAEEARARASQTVPFEPSQVKQLQAHEVLLGRHEIKLSNHDIEIGALKGSYAKLEGENREDHGKIFDKLDGIKDDLRNILEKKGS